MKKILQTLKDKKVVFITTKNLDYIRNTQEISLVRREAASCEVIGSEGKGYAKRLLHVFGRILTTDFSGYDVVFVGFAPQLVLPFFSWKFRKNVVIEDFFISLYDTLVFDRKKLKETSLGAKFFRKLDRKTLQKAKYIIADTKAHAAYFSEEFGCDRSKMQVFYLEADKDIYYPRKPLKKRNTFHVLYFGSILPLQGVDIVMQAVKELGGQKDISFEIIGPVKEQEKADTENVVYYPWLKQEELAEHIASADLCLAGHFNADIGKAKRTIPGKAYIYAAMDKPMILGDNPATHELYSGEDPGIYFVEMGNPHTLATLILQVAESERHKNG